MKGALIILSLVAMPISFYVQYSILQAIHADRLLMFLFWINLPVYVLITVISKLIEADKK